MSIQALASKTRGLLQRWVLLVGINYYEDQKIPQLCYCIDDTRELAEVLVSQPRYGYNTDRLHVLTSTDPDHKEANYRTILQNLIELAEATEKDDLLLFYFSGHGELVGGEAFLIPGDASSGHLLRDTAIPLRRIKEIMQSAHAQTKVIILDACYLGVDLEPGSRALLQSQDFIKKAFEDAQGIAVLAASAQDERSWEDKDLKHGIFTYFLLEVLRQAIQTDTAPYISLNELASFVRTKMRNWAIEHQRSVPRPTLDFQGSGEISLFAMDDSGPDRRLVNPLQVNPVSATFPMPVRETRDFSDREEELEQIKAALDTRADILVILQGIRCIGKTSFMNRIKKLLKEEQWRDRQFLHFSIEPTGAPNVEKFAQEMWGSIKHALQSAGLSIPSDMQVPFRFDGFSDFAYRLERLSDQFPDVTFVVFVDEFDKIVYDIGEVEYKRIMDLIHYIMEDTNFPLIVFISTLQELPRSYGSPIHSRTIVLRPFSREASDRLVKDLLHGYAQPGEEELAEIDEYAGGHPYIVKLILDKLYQLDAFSPAEGPIPMEVLHRAISQAVQDNLTRDLFGDVYKNRLDDDERYSLLWLASTLSCAVTAREFEQSTRRIRAAIMRLVDRGYISCLQDKYYLRLKLFGDWMNLWDEKGLEIERLRVAKTLEQARQNDAPITEATTEGVYINTSTQEVYVEGEKVKSRLTDMQFRALLYLAEAHRRVVSRDELANFLHPAEVYNSTDQSLDTLISHLREALNDRTRPYKYLETLRKRGFRLSHATVASTVSDR